MFVKLHENALFLRIFSNNINHKHIFLCDKIYAKWFFLMSQVGCWEVFNENGVFKLIQNTLESTCAEIFFGKVPGWSSATLFKKGLQRRFFPVNFEKF